MAQSEDPDNPLGGVGTKIDSSSTDPAPETPVYANPSPKPSLDQTLLTQQQGEVDFNNLLRPLLLKQMGLTEDYNYDPVTHSIKPGGKILRPMTEAEKIAGMTPEEKSTYDLNKAASEHAVKAAAGTLDVDPTVTAQLAEQKKISDALINQRLGPGGAAISTPGIKSNSLTQENAANVVSNFAHGEENAGMGLLSQGANSLLSQGNLFRQNQGMLLNSGNALPGMSQQAQGVPDAITGLTRYGNTINRQNQTALQGGLMNLAGTGAGLLLMA